METFVKWISEHAITALLSAGLAIALFYVTRNYQSFFRK